VRQHSEDNNGHLAHFLKFELAGSGVGACCLLLWLFGALQFFLSAPNGQYYLQRAVTPDQIIQQQQKKGPKGNKGTWRPDFHANT
jgi:hypothetical protein